MSKLVCEVITNATPNIIPKIWWCPNSPAKCTFSLNFNTEWTSETVKFPNPDPSLYITVILRFGKNNWLDAEGRENIEVMTFCSFPETKSEDGLDGATMFFRLRENNKADCFLTWNDLCKGQKVQWKHSFLWLKVVECHTVGLHPSSHFLDLNQRLYLQRKVQGDIPVKVLSARISFNSNFGYFPGFVSEAWFLQAFHQVWFTLSNIKLSMVDFTVLLTRICYLPCTGKNTSASQPMSRLLAEFVSNPASQNEANCIAYHIYMNILFSDWDHEYLKLCRKKAIELGFPLVIFDETKSKSRIVLLTAKAFIRNFPVESCFAWLRAVSGEIEAGVTVFQLPLGEDDSEDASFFPLFVPGYEYFSACYALTAVQFAIQNSRKACYTSNVYQVESKKHEFMKKNVDLPKDCKFVLNTKYCDVENEKWLIEQYALPLCLVRKKARCKVYKNVSEDVYLRYVDEMDDNFYLKMGIFCNHLTDLNDEPYEYEWEFYGSGFIVRAFAKRVWFHKLQI